MIRSGCAALLTVVALFGLAACGSSTGSLGVFASSATATPANTTTTTVKTSAGRADLTFRAVVQPTTDAQRAELAGLSCAAPGADAACDQNGTGYLLGPVIINGTQVSSASAEIDPNGSDWVVNLTFNSAASSTWAAYTSAHVGDQVAVVLNGRVVSAPTIESTLTGPTTISGNFTRQQADELADQLSGR